MNNNKGDKSDYVDEFVKLIYEINNQPINLKNAVLYKLLEEVIGRPIDDKHLVMDGETCQLIVSAEHHEPKHDPSMSGFYNALKS